MHVTRDMILKALGDTNGYLSVGDYFDSRPPDWQELDRLISGMALALVEAGENGDLEVALVARPVGATEEGGAKGVREHVLTKVFVTGLLQEVLADLEEELSEEE